MQISISGKEKITWAQIRRIGRMRDHRYFIYQPKIHGIDSVECAGTF